MTLRIKEMNMNGSGVTLKEIVSTDRAEERRTKMGYHNPTNMGTSTHIRKKWHNMAIVSLNMQ